MAKIEIRKRKNTKGKFLTGANCELFINDQRVNTARRLEFEVDARGVAVAKVELFVNDLIVSGEVKVKKKKVKNG